MISCITILSTTTSFLPLWRMSQRQHSSDPADVTMRKGTMKQRREKESAHSSFQNQDIIMIPPVYTKIATAYGEFALRQVPKVIKWGVPAAIFGNVSFPRPIAVLISLLTPLIL